MIELTPVTWALTYIFLVSVMLSIGLDVSAREVLAVLANARLLGRALVANLVVMPVVGLGVVHLFPLSPDIATGIVILAAAPGAPFAVNFTSRAKGGAAFAAVLLFVLTVVALVVTPPLAAVLVGANSPFDLPVWRVVRGAILYLVIPLLAGFALQHWVPDAARRLRTPVKVCAAVSFPAVVLLTMGMKSAATRAIGVPALAAVLTLVLVGMVAGWMLGGPSTATRQVLATGTSMRNAMVALLIARTSLPDSNVDLAVLTFSALMIPPNLIFTIYQNRRGRALAAREETPVVARG